MTAFLIADIKVTDEKWVPDYAASHDLLHKRGGKYRSRSGNVKTLEGAPLDTSLIAIMGFRRQSSGILGYRVRLHPLCRGSSGR